MVAVAETRRRDALVVCPDGAELLGISGREVAWLPGASDVKAQGEWGPYTVVTYDGRNGYVLTDSLMRREELMAASGEAVGELVANSEGPHTLATRLLQIVAGLAATGGIAAAIYAFISFPLPGV